MATAISFTFYGEKQVNRTIADREERVEDATPAWDAIADRFRVIESRLFQTQGGSSGRKWSPLSPRYARWKARVRPGAPILVFDGDLRKSLTERPFGIEVIEPGFMVIGSDVEYGAYHQRGEGVPRRRPVSLAEADRRIFVNILQRFLVTGRAG